MTITNPKLSDRIRPDVEAAPWVIAEIEKLEQQLAAKQAEIAAGRASRDAEVAGLYQQVTLLGSAMYRITFSRTGQCVDLAQELFAREEWAEEPLPLTEPKP